MSVDIKIFLDLNIQRLRYNTKRGQLMKNIFRFLLYSIICVSIFSCSQDLKFALPEIDPLLSIQSFVDPDNGFKLTVTMARPIQEQNIQMDRDCQVDIYENDLFFTSLNLDSSRFIQSPDTQQLLRFYLDPNVLFSENKEYKVEVKYPGFETVIAKTIKPNAVKIKRVSFRHLTGEMPDWYYNTPSKLHSDDHSDIIKRDTSLIEFTITFDDPIETTNFYRFGVKLITKGSVPNPYFDRKIQYASLADPDPPFMQVIYMPDYPFYSGWTNPRIYEILYNDINSSGKEQSLKILVPSGGGGGKYVIYLYTMSEDYYKYMLDRWKYFKTENDPFAEPIKFYSNSNNGCGIFAFSSMDTDTIQF